MDISQEIAESIEKSKKAVQLKEKMVLDAREEVKGHWIRAIIWIVIVGGCVISVIVDGSNNYVCAFWIVLGIFRIIHHIVKQQEYNAEAEEIESMSLQEFKHTYMK